MCLNLFFYDSTDAISKTFVCATILSVMFISKTHLCGRDEGKHQINEPAYVNDLKLNIWLIMGGAYAALYGRRVVVLLGRFSLAEHLSP